MSQSWSMGIARFNGDRDAEYNLLQVGYETHFPRDWAVHRNELTGSLRIPGYFYVRFQLTDKAQHSQILNQGGVKLVLPSAGSWPPHPCIIPDYVVTDDRDREVAERAGRVIRSHGRIELVMLAKYRITTGLYAGKVGQLIAHVKGWAWLNIDNATLRVKDTDIEPVLIEAKRRA